MLIDRYPVEDVFARVPEVAAQTDPVLKTLDSLLEDDALYQAVRADLGKRYQHTLVHGRHSTPVEVILRLLLRQTEEVLPTSNMHTLKSGVPSPGYMLNPGVDTS